ncbi:MAG: tetratricopeptide repeat protein [Phycisphaerae bacterium]
MNRSLTRLHWLWTAGMTVLVGATPCLMGCSTTTHQKQKEQAELKWSQVRAKVKHQLATQQFESGHIEAAITTARESLGLDPTNPQGHVLLIRAFLEQGNLADARRALQIATGLNLDSPDLAYTRGILAEHSGRLDVAITAYQHATELDRGRLEFVIAQAECLVALDRPDTARRLVADNLDRFDRDGTLDALFAEICLLEGDTTTAVESFRRAMTLLEDEDPDVAEQFGLLLARDGQFAEAVAVLRPLTERHDVELSGAVVRALAGAYLETGQPQAAADLLDPWLDENARDAAAWLLSARLALARNDPATAYHLTDAAIRSQPRNADAYMLHAYACWQQGQNHRAADSLRQILALEPEDPLARQLLDRVLADTLDANRDESPSS